MTKNKAFVIPNVTSARHSKCRFRIIPRVIPSEVEESQLTGMGFLDFASLRSG